MLPRSSLQGYGPLLLYNSTLSQLGAFFLGSCLHSAGTISVCFLGGGQTTAQEMSFLCDGFEYRYIGLLVNTSHGLDVKLSTLKFQLFVI